jgi:hypothetical protein
MEDGSVLCEVDFFTSEHLLCPFSDLGFFGQLKQQLEGLIGDKVLGEIDEYVL